MPKIGLLTDNERAVLAHVVISPDDWVAHANTATNIADPAAALQEKVSRWQAGYDVAKGRGVYKTRAEREAP